MYNKYIIYICLVLYYIILYIYIYIIFVTRCSLDDIDSIFSCALLYGASRTTLHKVLICVILFQEYHLLGQNYTGKNLSSIVLEAPDNIA